MNTLQLYTWNVLTPNIHVNRMTWKYCSSEPLKLAKLDKKRYMDRKKVQLSIINKWLENENVIICLQEVCKELLEEILSIGNVQVFYSNHKRFKNNDSNLVIICKGYDCSGIEENIIDRSMLKLTIQDIDIYNVHFYWKWSIEEINKISKYINNNVKQKFIICGDFNKQIEDLNKFMDNLSCIYLTKSKKYTATFKGKKVIIDHILISSSLVLKEYKVYKHVLGYKILYNVKRLCKLYEKKLLTFNSWKNKRTNNDISDHLPVKATVLI